MDCNVITRSEIIKSSGSIKSMLLDLGADICGIASVDRFADAPAGFHPLDVFNKCKSVVVFAKAIPPFNILCGNKVTYTHLIDVALMEVNRICYAACCKLEKSGIRTVMIPADDPYEYWDEENKHGRGIISLKHAGKLAGIGNIGKNTLLVNEKLGNMFYLGAFLTDTGIEPDPVVEFDYCSPKCTKCMEQCPVKALDGNTINQSLCRSNISIKTNKGFSLKNCSKCRVLCPNCLGVKQPR